MLLTMFHLGECHRFPSKWPTFGEGLHWGSLEGLSYHSLPYLPLFAHCFPIILPSSRSFDFSDPRRACTSFHGKKGLKSQEDGC
jgi:hypothetical protein